MIFEKYFFCGYTLKKPLSGNCVQTDVNAGTWIDDNWFTNDDEGIADAQQADDDSAADIDENTNPTVGNDGSTDKSIQDMADQKAAEGREEADKNRIIKEKINGTDVDVKAGGLTNPKSDAALVNQRDLPKEDSPATACTFSVFYMAAKILSDCNILPYTETADNAKKGDPPAVGKNMSVNGYGAGVTKVAGANDLEVGPATYVGSNPGGGEAFSNAKASKDLIDSLNKGELIHARVGDDPATKKSHSVLFTGYTTNPTNGKVVITVNDPDGGNQGKNRYSFYDPEKQQLFNIKDGKPEYDTRRELIRYQHITKKPKIEEAKK